MPQTLEYIAKNAVRDVVNTIFKNEKPVDEMDVLLGNVKPDETKEVIEAVLAKYGEEFGTAINGKGQNTSNEALIRKYITLFCEYVATDVMSNNDKIDKNILEEEFKYIMPSAIKIVESMEAAGDKPAAYEYDMLKKCVDRFANEYRAK